jgi:molecular chaperone DnaJ
MRRTVRKDITLPAGIDEGQVYTVRGEGNRGLNGGPAGDLRVVVSVKPHPFFERDGYNVLYDLTVTYVQAALGDKIQVPTLDGRVEFALPAGTQPGDVYKLSGKGIPVLNSNRKGNQLIRVSVHVPKNHTEAQKQALLAYNAAMGGNAVSPEEKKGLFGGKKKK